MSKKNAKLIVVVLVVAIFVGGLGAIVSAYTFTSMNFPSWVDDYTYALLIYERDWIECIASNDPIVRGSAGDFISYGGKHSGVYHSNVLPSPHDETRFYSMMGYTVMRSKGRIDQVSVNLSLTTREQYLIDIVTYFSHIEYNGNTNDIPSPNPTVTQQATPTPSPTLTPSPTPTTYADNWLTPMPTPAVSEYKYFCSFNVQFWSDNATYTYAIHSDEPLTMHNIDDGEVYHNMLQSSGSFTTYRHLSDGTWEEAYIGYNDYVMSSIYRITNWTSNFTLRDDSGIVIQSKTTAYVPVTPTPTTGPTPTPVPTIAYPTGLFESLNDMIGGARQASVDYVVYRETDNGVDWNWFITMTPKYNQFYVEAGVIMSQHNYWYLQWMPAYGKWGILDSKDFYDYTEDPLYNSNDGLFQAIAGLITEQGFYRWPVWPNTRPISEKGVTWGNMVVVYSSTDIYYKNSGLVYFNNTIQKEQNDGAITLSGWDQFLGFVQNLSLAIVGILGVAVWFIQVASVFVPEALAVMRSILSFLPVELWAMTIALIGISLIKMIIGREGKT